MSRKETLLRLRERMMQQRDALWRKLCTEGEWTDPEAAHGDLGDVAALDTEQDMLSQLAALESRELNRLDRAIAAISEGRYGICEYCQQKIPLARLRALPNVTSCIQCQREHELEGPAVHAQANWESAWEHQAREQDQELTARDISMDDSR